MSTIKAQLSTLIELAKIDGEFDARGLAGGASKP